MLKARFITAGLDGSVSFEKAISRFLEDNPDIEIANIEYNCNMIPTAKKDGYDGMYSVLIFYRETEKQMPSIG